MVDGSAAIVEAPVPGGPVYWGNQAPDPSMQPELAIDYEPKKKEVPKK